MIINNKSIDDSKINTLLEDIKEKKEIAGVKEEFIFNEITKYLKHNSRALSKIIESKSHNELKRSKEYKKIIKEIRKILHKVTGAYQTGNIKDREKLLKDLENSLKNNNFSDFIEIHKKLLSTNTSTRERLEIYPPLYREIFSITGIPKSILDLGAGINPVSFPWFNFGIIEYYVYELNKNDCKFLEKYFDIMQKHTNLKGKAEVMDLLKIKEVTFPKTDICFLFKVLEPLELSTKHKISEELLKKIKSKFIIVSFATRTMAKRAMEHEKRGWFEMMLTRLGYAFKKIEFENETFYIIENIK